MARGGRVVVPDAFLGEPHGQADVAGTGGVAGETDGDGLPLGRRSRDRRWGRFDFGAGDGFFLAIEIAGGDVGAGGGEVGRSIQAVTR